MPLRWVMAALLGLIGCARSAEQRADGQALYGSYCATCHGPKGQPNATLVATLGVVDLTSPAFVARATATLIDRQIRVGSADQRMPSFAGILAAPQRQALATYVLSLGRK